MPFNMPNPFGKYSLPNVLGRLFHRDFNPGPVGRQQFPTTGGVNVGSVQLGGQPLGVGVNYGGSNGWIGPQAGTNYGSPFAPTTGQGLDAVGQDYGAFQPQGLWGGTQAPTGGSQIAGLTSTGQGMGWATADGQAASGLLGHFMPRGNEEPGTLRHLLNR